MNKQLQAIKIACMRSNPRKDWSSSPIRMTDILVALHKTRHAHGVSIYTDGEIIWADKVVDDANVYWMLDDDDLEHQEVPTIVLLDKLLDKKNDTENDYD